MNVDHLLILYPDGRDKDKSGETGASAEALSAKQLAKIELMAEKLATKEGAKAKAKTGVMMPANVLRFDYNKKLRYLDCAKKDAVPARVVEAAKVAKKAAKDAAKEDAKKDEKKDEKKDDSPQYPTWGVYLILHGSGGAPSLRDKHDAGKIAQLIKSAAPKGKWRLKKVCIVGCTLGSVADGETDSYVKKVCDNLASEGTLVGGYTVQVFVASPGHVGSQPNIGWVGTPALGLAENKGKKFITLPEGHPSRVSDTDGIERMTDDFRATYKVAWRWTGKASEQVDVMREWYHQ